MKAKTLQQCKQVCIELNQCKHGFDWRSSAYYNDRCWISENSALYDTPGIKHYSYLCTGECGCAEKSIGCCACERDCCSGYCIKVSLFMRIVVLGGSSYRCFCNSWRVLLKNIVVVVCVVDVANLITAACVVEFILCLSCTK